MNLVKLFSLGGFICCKPAYNRGLTPPIGQVLFPYAKAVAPLRRVRPAWLGGGWRSPGRLRAGTPLSDASVAREPDGLPPQDSAQDRLGRGRPPGGIRGGATGRRQHRRRPGRDEEGHPGRRRRALLLARGRGLPERPAGRRVQSRLGNPAGRRDDHHAGRPRTSFSPGRRRSPASCGKSSWPGRSRPTCPRTRSSSSTSIRSSSGSAPTASRRPPRSISARR